MQCEHVVFSYQHLNGREIFLKEMFAGRDLGIINGH